MVTSPVPPRTRSQGFWGSSSSSNHLMHDFIKKMFHDLMSSKPKGTSEEPISRQKTKFTRGTSEEPISRQKTKFIQGHSCSCRGCKQIKHLLSHDLAGTTEEYKKKFWNDFAKDLDEAKETRPEIKEDAVSFISGIYKNVTKVLKSIVTQLLQFVFGTSEGICKTAKVVKNIAICLAKWKWGTTNNFLYKWNSNFSLSSKEHISLVDSGLDINIAFPLMLPPHRNIDLILSFDFSEGVPFRALRKTAERFPFPNINIEDDDKKIPSRSCYVFEGDGEGTPDVMYFPLFNNQVSEGKVDEMREKYSTVHASYDEPQVKELLEVSKNNVEMNYNQIHERIKQCVQRSNQRRAKKATAYGVKKTPGTVQEKYKDD